MTLTVAESEAKRRTDALGTTHYVIARASRTDANGYMVTPRILAGYVCVSTFAPSFPVCDTCKRAACRGCAYPLT